MYSVYTAHALTIVQNIIYRTMSNRRKHTSFVTKKSYSKYHPKQTCSDCALCGHPITTAAHFEGWSTTEKHFIIKHLGTAVTQHLHMQSPLHRSEAALLTAWVHTQMETGCTVRRACIGMQSPTVLYNNN